MDGSPSPIYDPLKLVLYLLQKKAVAVIEGAGLLDGTPTALMDGGIGDRPYGYGLSNSDVFLDFGYSHGVLGFGLDDILDPHVAEEAISMPSA